MLGLQILVEARSCLELFSILFFCVADFVVPGRERTGGQWRRTEALVLLPRPEIAALQPARGAY